MVEEQTIKCAECGKEVPCNSHRQKYCPECSRSINKQRSLDRQRRLNAAKPLVTLKCARCRKEFTLSNSGSGCRTPKKYCTERCRKLAAKERMAAQKEADRRREELLRELAAKTLDDWLREAAECRLDYGTYRALRYMGKTYDELKATAGERRLQVHNSTSHQHFLRI